MTDWIVTDVDELYPYFATKRAAKGFWKSVHLVSSEQQSAALEIKSSFGRRDAFTPDKDFLKEAVAFLNAGTATRRKLRRIKKEARRKAVQS